MIEYSPSTGKYPCFFTYGPGIVRSLAEICNEWASYLEHFLNESEALLGNAKLPWEHTERAVISTLAASIIRSFPTSILLEEARISKSGRNGRCDLWASIPELEASGKRFSFYLEARTTAKAQGSLKLPDFLKSHYGISKIFRDYLKSQSRIAKLSPYGRKGQPREQDHYVIGMLITKLRDCESISEDMSEHLRAIFENPQKIETSRTDAPQRSTRKRRMGRFPTVALVLHPANCEGTGMMATLTVLVSSKGLLASAKQPPDHGPELRGGDSDGSD